MSITGGAGDEHVTYPGNYSEVIAVSAIDVSLNRYERSNYGEANEICAPGVDIYSITPSEGRKYESGTFFAAPLVSSTIGLMLSANLPQDIREILQDTSQDIGVNGKDIFFGNGLLNASAALSSSLSPETITTITVSESSTTTNFLLIFLIVNYRIRIIYYFLFL